MSTLPPQVQLPNSTRIRIFHQIQQWLSVDLQADNWGWKLSSNNLKPVATEDSPAPPFLMKLVFCNYQGGCSDSSSNEREQCTCRRNALRCADNAVAQRSPIQLWSKRTMTFWTYYGALCIHIITRIGATTLLIGI